MIGDKIIAGSYHFAAAKLVMNHINSMDHNGAFSVSIAGESGSGKSEIALCLKELLVDERKRVVVLGQDDYFHLPPHSNHEQRKLDIGWVGSKEVRLDLMNEHVRRLRSLEPNEIVKPLVYFEEDYIKTERVRGPFDTVIAEGTYTSLLTDIDVRVFIDRDYKQTKKDRLSRNRDQALEGGKDLALDFLKAVLEIEHKIIREHKHIAQVVIPPPEALLGGNHL